MRRQPACWAAAVLVVFAGLPPQVEGAASPSVETPAPATPPAVAAPRAMFPARLRNAALDPELADLALYLDMRVAAAAGDFERATILGRTLLDRYPDSIWEGRTCLDLGRVRHRTGDLAGAGEWLEWAAEALPQDDRAIPVVALHRAELAHELGDEERALELAAFVREGRPRGIVVRRARRLVERIRDCPGRERGAGERLAEADLRLVEGDALGAQAEALAVLTAAPTREARDHALWAQARAAWSLGMHEAAEALCLALATGDVGAYNARALAQAARWRWNADDDPAALRLFREVARRFPDSREGPEALYAIARIQQESGEYDDALRTYDALAHAYPSSRTAAEARWRAAWVRYLAGDHLGAAERFARLAQASERETRVAAEYWEARALDHAGDPQARAKLVHVAEQHPATFYGMLAGARLGLSNARPSPEVLAPERPPFPDALTLPHAIRARRYGELGLPELARRELDAISGAVSNDVLLQAYAAVEAPGPALRLARVSLGSRLRRYLYPLGYWEVVRPMAEARGLDPLLVAALIRQESLFFPDAVSPADAHGLMQLLPTTARELAEAAGRPVPDRSALHRVTTNIDLGTSLLRRLLDRYGGSRVKALAAYNAGERAVAKWERRYAGRPEDEFVELISYRETRDYVKAVLTHYEVYRQLYASEREPSPSATSRGSPPNEPLDMITMTSPARAESRR
jgi:soluble lytic murein transglycosylase